MRKKNGERVKLIDHMRDHWREIGFEPNLFELADDDINEVFEEETKGSQRFTPKKAPIVESDLETYSGVMVKNLPKEISEEDARKFLESKGMPEGHVFVVMRAGKGTTIEIEDLSKEHCAEVIKNLHEKRYFNQKIFCRGLKELITPTKDNAATEDTDDEESEEEEVSEKGENTTAQTIPIPGLPASQLFKEVKKKKPRKTNTATPKGSLKKVQDLKKVTKNDFLKVQNPFSALTAVLNEDEDEDNGERTSNGLFSRSPLDSAREATEQFSDDEDERGMKRPLQSPEISEQLRRVRNKSNA